MHIIEQRFLRGPNIHADSPCLLTVLELEDLYGRSTKDLPGFTDALLACLPSLHGQLLPFGQPGGFAQRLREGTYLGRVVEQVTLELQTLAGTPASYGRTRPVSGHPGRFRIVCAYQCEKLAQPAFALAADLVTALAHGSAFELAPRLDELRAIVQRHAIDPGTAAVLAAAHERGIPVQRITEDANLFQLGWGVKQKRLQAALTSDTSFIATRVARDTQLARALLEEAGVPVVERDGEGREYQALVAAGEVVAATTGTGEDVLGLLPESTRELCVRAAARIGLDVAGIDIVCRDISLPLAAQGGGVADVRPAADKGAAGAAILDGLMGESDGRIPVIAVTGTNGKTTTTLLIGHTVRMAGLRAGVTTTEGVFIDGRRIVKGDCTGYWSARTVLGAPDVEFAVLETARGGILKRGLAFDRCDVGVVLNVATDHLGLDGIDTIEDLAQVKAVVALSASKAAVLNAEDALCVAMARRVRPGAEILFFSMEADNPVLLKHLADGGRGVYLQDGALVVADGSRHQALVKVDSMPVSFEGRARFNIANSLAAAAALMAAGFAPMAIATGLSTFVSNGRTNPLRTNVFDVRGVTVIVDYAHNPAAYTAMAEMARALLPGQLVGVVTAPGDRRDEDLRQVGRVCGARFDELVVYESQSRGREVGEAVDLILAGAQEVVGLSDTLHREVEVGAAVRLGLSLCRPGDVLVFATGASLAVFVEAIRGVDPESADLIASLS